jgi:hypothetical protein
MRSIRRMGAIAVAVAVGSLGLTAPAQADGGDLNGYWQLQGKFSTYEACDAVGRPYVPSQADGWSCTHYVPQGKPTVEWNLYLVFGS